jgi:hypothetical protein
MRAPPVAAEPLVEARSRFSWTYQGNTYLFLAFIELLEVSSCLDQPTIVKVPVVAVFRFVGGEKQRRHVGQVRGARTVVTATG